MRIISVLRTFIDGGFDVIIISVLRTFMDGVIGVRIISVLRNFMEFGWEGISFEGEAVRKRS